MWRPEGWNNNKPFFYGSRSKEYCYEAGADAMIEALKKEGVHFESDEWTDDATFCTEHPGTVVFIPDET